MPARSIAQRELFAIAEHHPEALNKKNKGLAKLSHQTLHDFAATPQKGLPQHVSRSADGRAAMTNTTYQQGEMVRPGKQPEWLERITVTKTPPSVLADGKLSDAFGSNKGGLHRATHTPEGETIPVYRVRQADHSKNAHVRHMAQAAINMNPGRYGKAGRKQEQ